MLKKLFCALLISCGFCLDAMQKEEVGSLSHLLDKVEKNKSSLSVEEWVTLRIAQFDLWKTGPDIAGKLDLDDPQVIGSYIHLTMFLREPEETAKLPNKIAEATQFSQKICPSYQFWPDYYQCFSRTIRGKCYKNEEQMELILGPTMDKIIKLRIKMALLQGRDFTAIAQSDWKKEVEALGKRDNWSLISVIPLVLPPKQKELSDLQKMFCFQSHNERYWENILAIAQRDQENQKKLIEQEKAHILLKQDIDDLQKILINQKDEVKHLDDQLKTNQVVWNSKENELKEVAKTNWQIALQKQDKLLAAAKCEKEMQQQISEILQEKDAQQIEIDQLRREQQQKDEVCVSLQEKQNRIKTHLALFEASKVVGWETLFVDSVKAELQ